MLEDELKQSVEDALKKFTDFYVADFRLIEANVKDINFTCFNLIEFSEEDRKPLKQYKGGRFMAKLKINSKRPENCNFFPEEPYYNTSFIEFSIEYSDGDYSIILPEKINVSFEDKSIRLEFD